MHPENPLYVAPTFPKPFAEVLEIPMIQDGSSYGNIRIVPSSPDSKFITITQGSGDNLSVVALPYDQLDLIVDALKTYATLRSQLLSVAAQLAAQKHMNDLSAGRDARGGGAIGGTTAFPPNSWVIPGDWQTVNIDFQVNRSGADKLEADQRNAEARREQNERDKAWAF